MQTQQDTNQISETVLYAIELVKKYTILESIAKKKGNLLKQYREKDFSIPKPKIRSYYTTHIMSKNSSFKSESPEINYMTKFITDEISTDCSDNSYDSPILTREGSENCEPNQVLSPNQERTDSFSFKSQKNFQFDKSYAYDNKLNINRANSEIKYNRSLGFTPCQDIIERICSFKKEMHRRCTKEKISLFCLRIQKLLEELGDWQYNSNFRNVKVDPLADAMLLIVANSVDINVKEFLGCLKPGKNLYPYRITEIKTFKSYKEVKKLFDRIKF